MTVVDKDPGPFGSTNQTKITKKISFYCEPDILSGGLEVSWGAERYLKGQQLEMVFRLNPFHTV
jgi:hypothetical protein